MTTDRFPGALPVLSHEQRIGGPEMLSPGTQDMFPRLIAGQVVEADRPGRF